MQRTLNIFRLIALLEGSSFLSFAITMPLKYQFSILWPNLIIGFIPGFLFLTYVLLLFWVTYLLKWSLSKFLWAFIASLLPFGTFIMAKNYLNKNSEFNAEQAH
ncbi:MAG: DUF3817 domain-containing protein [Flammeovirgaceae bacterium]|nr:DUF3817 domain-containing protein [Flammeovirgaceae bacterium]